MKKMKVWVLTATRPLVLTMAFCGATAFMTGCKKANVQENNPQSENAAQTVKSEELIRTSNWWQ